MFTMEDFAKLLKPAVVDCVRKRCEYLGLAKPETEMYVEWVEDGHADLVATILYSPEQRPCP